jgi:predicted transcriptional regulator
MTKAVTKPRIAEYKLDAISVMAHSGRSVAEIADATGVPDQTVRNMLQGGANKKFDDLHEGHRQRILQSAVQAKAEILDLVDVAWPAIRRAITQVEDVRLARDTAFDVLDRAGMGATPAAQNELNVNVGLQNVHVEGETVQAFSVISEKFGELLGALQGQDPKRHELTAAEALPKFSEPASQEVDVVDVDFSDTEPDPDA